MHFKWVLPAVLMLGMVGIEYLARLFRRWSREIERRDRLERLAIAKREHEAKYGPSDWTRSIDS
jgi:hypothetical protein